MKILNIQINNKFGKLKPDANIIQPANLYHNFKSLNKYLQTLISEKQLRGLTTTKIIECIYTLCELIERFNKDVVFLEISYNFHDRDIRHKQCQVNINELRNYFYHHLTFNLISNNNSKNIQLFVTDLSNFMSLFYLNNDIDSKKINFNIMKNMIIDDIARYASVKSKNFVARTYLNDLIECEIRNSPSYSIEDNLHYVINKIDKDNILSCVAFSQISTMAMHHMYKIENDRLKYVKFDTLIKNQRYYQIFVECAVNKLTRSFKIIEGYYHQLQIIAKDKHVLNKKALIFCISKINSELRLIEKLDKISVTYDIKPFNELMLKKSKLLDDVKDFRANKSFRRIISLLRHGNDPVELSSNLNSNSNALMELKGDYCLDNVSWEDKSSEYIDAVTSIQLSTPSFLHSGSASKEEMCKGFLESIQNIKDTMNEINTNIEDPIEIKELSNYLFKKIAVLSQFNDEYELGLAADIRKLVFSPLFNKIVEPNLSGQWIEDRGTFLRSEKVKLIEVIRKNAVNHLIEESKDLLNYINKSSENNPNDSVVTYFYPCGSIGSRRPFYLTQYENNKDKMGVKFYIDKGFTHSVFEQDNNNDTPTVDVTLDAIDDSGKVKVNISMLLNGNNMAIFFKEMINNKNTVSTDVEEKKLAYR